MVSGMSLEAGNRRKSPVTLAVTTGYFFSLKKIMRENLSSISNTTYSACIYWSACLRLQIFTNKHCYISSNPNNISRYFPLIGDEIVDGEAYMWTFRWEHFFTRFWGSLPSTFKIFRPWKKSSTKKSWPTFCNQYFWEFPIWNSHADEKHREIRMVKVNVIFRDWEGHSPCAVGTSKSIVAHWGPLSMRPVNSD
jgi:hypothetical protein